MSHHVNVTGEQYIRTLAHYIRSNDRRLFSSQPSPTPSGHRRLGSSGSGSFSLSNLWSISTALAESLKTLTPDAQTLSTTTTNSNSPHQRSILITLDHYHFYFLLSKFSEYGYDVGAFEAIGDQPGLDISDPKDFLETSSVASTNSVNSISSAMSSLSLFSGWQGWSTAAQIEAVPLEDDIKFIYRACMKLSGIKIATVTQTRIEGSESWSLRTMLSLTPFRNLSHLEIYKLPIKMLDGWDVLQERLEILVVQNGTIDDIYELFVEAVIESMKRRKTEKNKKHIDTEEEQAESSSHENSQANDDPTSILPARIWPRLTNVNFSENSLTFIANEPIAFVTSITHLDLSHNLLIAIPTALSQLHNLEYLNLSYNMIETVLNVYQTLGNVTRLELRNNRIENLCGLERVWSLECIDVRENRLTDCAEVGRMVDLPEIKEIYVDGNPFIRHQPNYRVSIFQAYKEKDIDIYLDGTGPSMRERHQISVTPKQSPDSHKIPAASLSKSLSMDNLKVASASATRIPGSKLGVKKRPKRRIVDPSEEGETNSGTDKISDTGSDASERIKGKKKKDSILSPTAMEQKKPVHRTIEVEKAAARDSDPRIRELRRKKSGLRALTMDTPPRSPALNSAALSDSDVLASPLTISPVGSPVEGFRDRLANLRNEGGSAWLQVYGELDYTKMGDNKLRGELRMMKNEKEQEKH